MVLTILVFFAMPLVVNAADGDPIWDEDMSDVSDWIAYPDRTITTDGYISSIEFASDQDWNLAYTDSISLELTTFVYYLEIRYKSNVTIRDMFIRFYSEDGPTGEIIQAFVITDPDTSWNIYQELITTRTTIESILITGEASGNANFQVDYVYIISSEVTDTDNIFYVLFLSLEMWGYLGPVALVIIGYLVAERNTALGVMWFIVECLFVSRYIELVGATPDYWWHILIILLGGLFTCIFPAVLKRR